MRRLTLGLGAIALAIVAGCATERPTRTYVQPNFVDKSVFRGEWYYRQTVADVPPTTAVTFTGESYPVFNVEKVRWEIQEKFLVAFRSYELIPGSTREADQENKATGVTRFAEGEREGRTDGFREAPIAAFPIEKHFDIFRQYNPTTGEEINVLEENDRDRPWYERRYMRVDWSKNQVVNFLMLTPLVGQWYVQENEGGRDKFRIEYRRGANGRDEAYYFDFVTKLFVDPDLYGCILTVYNYAAEDCASAEVAVRSSFLKVDAPREFEPVPYDDRKMSKFGYFRTERLTYNRARGITQTGRIYLANVHNIFGKVFERDQNGNILYVDRDGNQVFYNDAIGFHYLDQGGRPIVNAEGKVLAPAGVKPLYMPREKRPLKPIVYHLSPRYPKEMIRGAELVAESWNRAFRRAAAAAQNRSLEDGSFNTLESCETAHGGGACTQVASGGFCRGGQCEAIPDMFILHYNGWVKSVGGREFTDFSPLRDANHASREVSFRYDTTHEVAQIGDLRYNHMYWIHQNQVAGPLGYGPSAADPETGEIISGTAYVYGAAVDTYATFALDTIKVLSGKMSVDDLASGRQVADYITRNLDRADPRARIASELMDLPLPEAKARMLGPNKLAKIELVKQFGLEPARPGYAEEVMRRIRESGLDNLLINDEIRIAKARGLWRPGTPLTAEEKARIDLTSWASPQHLIANTKTRWMKALRNNLTLAEFADDGVLGLAMQYAQRSPQELEDGGPVWQELRTLIFRAVMEHEVGHTLGLRHNFQGSFDSLNYFDAYWQLRKQGDSAGVGGIIPVSQIRRLSDALNMATRNRAQKEGSMHEYMYSTVMDYGSRFNSDVHGIGKYDEAAILFAYANAVEVFDFDRDALDPETQELVDFTANKPSPVYDALTEMVHYTQVPVRFGGGDVNLGVQRMRQRRVVNWDQLQAMRAQAEVDTSVRVPLEVPYMFCSDDWVGAIASCQLWDVGADHYEITADVIHRYKNYYFFNNYKRDRHPFYSDMVLSRVFSRYLTYLPNMYQHWLFSQFYSSSVDGLGDLYWTISTFDGLNLLGEILTQPEYGSYSLDSQTNLYRWESYAMGRGQVDIPVGDGRRTFSRFDWDSGYYLFDRTLEVGHFWDYIAAIFALVQSEATVLGVEIASDFTTYLIPYYLVFEEEVTRLVNGIYGRDYQAIAPRINNGRLAQYPAVDINGTNAAPAGVPVELDINFTKQIYAMLYGMAFFTSSFSLHFPDQAQIFRLGSGEAVQPGQGYQLDQFTDPTTGHAYGAFVRTTGTTNTIAAKLITKGKDLAARYVALRAQLGENPNPNDPRFRQLRSLEFQISDLVADINVLRSLYQVFGRVI